MDSTNDRQFFSIVSLWAEKAIHELKKLKENRTPNLYILSNNYGIADYYANGLKLESTSSTGLNYSLILLAEMKELTKNSKRKTILKEKIQNAKKTRLTLQKILENEEVITEEVDESLKFFEDISKKCRDYLES